MKKTIFSLFFFLIFHILVHAQSVFSSAENGIGIREYITTSRAMGMGNTGLALKDTMSLNSYNSSSWRHINNTKINISMRYNYVKTDLGFQDFTSSTANFSGLQLGVPIKKNQWVFGLSITPYSTVNFSYILNFQSSDNNYEENAFYEGNITRPQLSLAWSADQRLGLAVNLNYYFGTIEDRYFIDFSDPDNADAFYNIEYRLQGPGLGVSFDFEPLDKLRMGGFLDFQTRLNFSRVSVSPINFEEQKINSKATLPMLFGIGGSYQFGAQWLATADLAYQDWSDGLKTENFETANLDKWYNIGFGFERSRKFHNAKSIFNKIDLRAGFSHRALGYLFNKNTVNEYAIHFGVGIPFFQGNARLDLGFKGGIRGELDKTIAEEIFFRTIISISAGELWFQNIR
jgi:hypothetical protein